MTRALLAVVMMVTPAVAFAQASPDGGTPPVADSSQTPAEGEGEGEALEGEQAQPQAGGALANAVQARTPEAQAAQSGFQFIAAEDLYLGTGTFVDPDKYASFYTFLTIIPQYLFSVGKQRLVASASIRGLYEFTMPDNATGRRWSIYDTGLSLSAPALFREKWLTGIAFSPSIGLTIPTSPESWNAGLITTLRLGLVTSRSFHFNDQGAGIDFRVTLNGTRSFHTQRQSGYRNPTLTGGALTDKNGVSLATCRGAESLCGLAGNNTEWTFAAGGFTQLRVNGNLLFYVGYTFIRSWTYSVTEQLDEYSSQAVTNDGERAVKSGNGVRDMTTTFFGASYQINDHYSVDLGVYTAQAPLAPDNKTVRFPFWAVHNQAANATSLFFTLTAAY